MARWRLAVGLLGLGLLTGGVIALAFDGRGGGWVAIVWGAILFFGLAYERIRYKELEVSRPGDGWIATEERFIDPATSKPVRVYVEPGTGERKYVVE